MGNEQSEAEFRGRQVEATSGVSHNTLCAGIIIPLPCFYDERIPALNWGVQYVHFFHLRLSPAESGRLLHPCPAGGYFGAVESVFTQLHPAC